MSHQFQQGSIPLLCSFPHNGSFIADNVAATMTDAGRTSLDTDWFLDRLYDIPELNGASRIVAEHSRYVIDLNRPRDDVSLYPGQTTTGLVPKTRFDGCPVYATEPDHAEIERRIESIWNPYHRQIRTELDRMVQQFGNAVLLEAHSIASKVPRLFEGTLPDFNIGTNHNQSCCPKLTNAVLEILRAHCEYSHVENGRFIGGYITRHFGNPAGRVHAIQIELSQATYLDESAKQWNDIKARKVQTVFRAIINGIRKWMNH